MFDDRSERGDWGELARIGDDESGEETKGRCWSQAVPAVKGAIAATDMIESDLMSMVLLMREPVMMKELLEGGGWCPWVVGELALEE
jgi:hypothetical protein